jgi:hypothetical protein
LMRKVPASLARSFPIQGERLAAILARAAPIEVAGRAGRAALREPAHPVSFAD